MTPESPNPRTRASRLEKAEAKVRQLRWETDGEAKHLMTAYRSLLRAHKKVSDEDLAGAIAGAIESIEDYLGDVAPFAVKR